MQILILGMHRSGTSLTARLVNMMGAYFGPPGCALKLAPDNPRGHWERRDFMPLNDRLLALQHCRWFDLARWRFSEAAHVPPPLQQEMQRFIGTLDAHRPWFLKDPRLCLTLPAWLPLLETPVGVLVYRDPQEIAQSLQTRSKLPPRYSIALWEYHAVGLLNTTRHLPRLHVSHAGLLAQPVETGAALYRQLCALGVAGLRLPAARAIEDFVDPLLYRAHVPAPLVALSREQEDMAQMLQSSKIQTGPLQVSKASEEIMKAGMAALAESKKQA